MQDLTEAPYRIRLSARERASFAAASQGLMLVNGETTATVERNDPIEDTSGGRVDNWLPVFTLTGALRQAQGQREEVQGEQVRSLVDWEFLTRPYEVDRPAWKRVKPADRLVIRDGQAGEQVYHVVGDDSHRTGQVVMVISLTAVEGER